MRMKNVIGVAAVIVVIMVIVLIAFSSTVSATSVERNYTADGGVLWYEGKLDGYYSGKYRPDKAEKILDVYEGEKILFLNKTLNKSFAVTVFGPYEGDGDWYSDYDEYTVLNGTVWDAEGKPTKGWYRVIQASEYGGWFSLKKHSFSLELEDTKVREKASFNLTLKTNNKKGGVMKLTIEDHEGFSIANVNNTYIYEVLVKYTEKEFTSDPVDKEENPVDGIRNNTAGELVFDTKQLDMKEGKYKIILEDYATEVDDDVTITVEKWYLEMECDDEVVKGWEDIVITIQSSYYEEDVNLTVEGIPGWEEKTLTLDDGGKKRVRISTKNVDYGRYKVTVEVVKFTECAETRYVTIKKGETRLEVDKNATVGDIVHIEGTSNFGYLAVFVIDDVYKSDAAIVDDKFEWYWDTARELDGYRGIEVFILNDRPSKISIGDEVSEDWQREEGVDASATIFLDLPAFSMTVSKCIAKGDPAVIRGTATGADHVYVIVMNYKGEVMYPPSDNPSMVNATTTPVEDSKWTETIDKLDSGEYAVIALSEGKDGITEAINENDEWEIGGESKTLEQRVAYLVDAITTAGSDDLYKLAYFTVRMPEVRLKVPETVEIGTAIEVKAETNIKTGEKVFISLSQNSSIIKKNSTDVKNGSVTASIDTSGLQPGRYNVAVDISGRASAEKEMVLVEKGKEPIPKNESLTEPAPEAVKEANETVGEGEFLNETGEGGGEVQKKIPVNMCDLLIAVVVAIFISFVVRRRG